MKWVPLVVKTSDRISSSSLEETPMDRSSFVFELGSKLCLFILFLQPVPWGLPRTTRSPLIWRKVAPGRRVTRLPQLPQASQHFLHFLTETWRLITSKTRSSWYRFHKQNRNSSRASRVFVNLFAVTTLYRGHKHPKTNFFFSIYTLMTVLPKPSFPRKNHLHLINLAS